MIQNKEGHKNIFENLLRVLMNINIYISFDVIKNKLVTIRQIPLVFQNVLEIFYVNTLKHQ